MKALVTGATGFIGSHLVDSLIREGLEVSCLVRDTSNMKYLEDLYCRTVRGDCTESASLAAAVRGVDYVFHLAGLTKACTEEDFYRINAKGTENLIEAVRLHNPTIKRFVHLSSLAAVGPSADSTPLTETCTAAPVSLYGKSKLEGERAVLRRRDDLPVTVIRPPAVYGPRDRDLLVFFKMTKSGIVPYWGKCSYSFIYIDDLIRGIIRSALSEQARGEIFFLSDGNIYSTDDIIDAIAEAVQRRPMRVSVPRFVMPLLGLISEKVKGAAIINSDKIREMQHSYWICDTSKARERLQFEPKVNIREGARWTADWYTIHQWL
ncbi:MAG: NAD(P)-dependent oxidoreductase [Nitrospirota bacterium]